MGIGTRREVKNSIKNGEVMVNGKYITKPETKVRTSEDIIEFRGEEINFREHVYLMLNKPKGYVSSTEDSEHRTIMELIPGDYFNFKLAPVGRLDKDTTGLILLTNDGGLNHALTSPKRGVEKVYYALVDRLPNEEEIEKFQTGLDIGEQDLTRPAKLEIYLEDGENLLCKVIITEGRYHQVKRMFMAIGIRVIDLHRDMIGTLGLDENLEEGEFRELSEDEVEELKKL